MNSLPLTVNSVLVLAQRRVSSSSPPYLSLGQDEGANLLPAVMDSPLSLL